MSGAWLPGNLCAKLLPCRLEEAEPWPVCPSLLTPTEQGIFSSSDPRGSPKSRALVSSLSLKSVRLCLIVFGSHWPQCSLSASCRAASSWWNLALLISISDVLDMASFIIQGELGDETTVDILPTGV